MKYPTYAMCESPESRPRRAGSTSAVSAPTIHPAVSPLVTVESLLRAWSVWYRVEVNIGPDDERLPAWRRRLRRSG